MEQRGAPPSGCDHAYAADIEPTPATTRPLRPATASTSRPKASGIVAASGLLPMTQHNPASKVPLWDQHATFTSRMSAPGSVTAPGMPASTTWGTATAIGPAAASSQTLSSAGNSMQWHQWVKVTPCSANGSARLPRGSVPRSPEAPPTPPATATAAMSSQLQPGPGLPQQQGSALLGGHAATAPLPPRVPQWDELAQRSQRMRSVSSGGGTLASREASMLRTAVTLPATPPPQAAPGSARPGPPASLTPDPAPPWEAALPEGLLPAAIAAHAHQPLCELYAADASPAAAAGTTFTLGTAPGATPAAAPAPQPQPNGSSRTAAARAPTAAGPCSPSPDISIPAEEILYDHPPRVLGTGAFGVVYEGRWRGEDVVVKWPSGLLEEPSRAEGLLQEAHLMVGLNHRNIVKLLGIVVDQGRLGLVMEHAPLGSLSRLLHDSRHAASLTPQRRLRMAIDVAQGMLHLHKHNRVHRDLKTPNLLVFNDWTVKICDLGLARMKVSDESLRPSTLCPGTLGYIAPELLEDKSYSNKVDVYSYGAVLWELATGQKPWKELMTAAVMYRTWCTSVRLDIPKGLDQRVVDLILACWSKDPALRPSFEEVLHQLRQLTGLCPPSATVHTLPPASTGDVGAAHDNSFGSSAGWDLQQMSQWRV